MSVGPDSEPAAAERGDEPEQVGWSYPLSIDEQGDGNDGEAISIADSLADPVNVAEQAENRVFAYELLSLAQKTAPRMVREALEAVYSAETTLSDFASELGVHRTTVRRGIDHWAADQGITLAG